MSQMRIDTYEDLLAVLQRDSVLHRANRDDNSVQIPTQKNGIEGVMVIRWQEDDGMLQFIQSLPIEVPEDRVDSMARAICRLNHALPAPGFNMNVETRTVYYRLPVPLAPLGYVWDKQIQTYFAATLRNAVQFVSALSRIALDGYPADRLFELIRSESNDEVQEASQG